VQSKKSKKISEMHSKVSTEEKADFAKAVKVKVLTKDFSPFCLGKV